MVVKPQRMVEEVHHHHHPSNALNYAMTAVVKTVVKVWTVLISQGLVKCACRSGTVKTIRVGKILAMVKHAIFIHV
jgi:hypothetical protein